jgi:hypothetical protein
MLLGLFMPNRTISLSPIGDLIRKRMVKDGFPFSCWVEEQLIEWNRSTRMGLDHDGEPLEPKKDPVPFHFECQKCHQRGKHWTKDCTWGTTE